MTSGIRNDSLNILTSFLMPLKEKTIRNINKNKNNKHNASKNNNKEFSLQVQEKNQNNKGNQMTNQNRLIIQDRNNNQQKIRQKVNNKFRQSNFSIDGQTAPQYMPQNLEQTNAEQSKIQIQFNPINPFNIANKPPLPPASINKISNVSINPITNLKISNISRTSNKQLKTSNAKELNSIIKSTNESMASFPQIGSTIPSVIKNDNKQHNAIGSVISNADTFIGYNTLGSAMPSFLNQGSNTSRYAANPLQVRESSYMGLKNPFQNKSK